MEARDRSKGNKYFVDKVTASLLVFIFPDTGPKTVELEHIVACCE